MAMDGKNLIGCSPNNTNLHKIPRKTLIEIATQSWPSGSELIRGWDTEQRACFQITSFHAQFYSQKPIFEYGEVSMEFIHTIKKMSAILMNQ
jgi:hypothetical protein